MNDLLRRSFSGPKSYVDLKRDTMRHDLESGPAAEMVGMDSDRNLGRFLEEANQVKSKMEAVKDLLLKLQEANEECKTIHRAQAVKAIRLRMDKDVEKVLKLAKEIKGNLEDLDRANVENRRLPGCGEGTSTDRTRTAVTATMRKKLKDLMGEFQALRQRIKGEYKETIERRYYTVTGEHADDEKIETMIETGESESFLQKAIQEQGRAQVLETLKEIQERHDAVKDIEKNLLELHQIFLDMAVLVEAQGEQLNDIEQQVNRASSFIEKGTSHLGVAKKHQRSTRKWTCIALIILLIVLVVVLAPILIKLRNNNKSSSNSTPPPPAT